MRAIYNVRFDATYEICPKHSEYGMILSMLDNCNAFELHKELLQQIIEKYELATKKKHTDPLARIYPRNILLDMLSKYNTGKSMKSQIQSNITKAMEQHTHLYQQLIVDVVDELTSNIKIDGICKSTQCHQLVTCIYLYMDTAHVVDFAFILDKVLPFHVVLLEAFVGQLLELNEEKTNKCLSNVINISQDISLVQLLTQILKQILNIFSKTTQTTTISNHNKSRGRYTVDFVELTCSLLSSPQLIYDLKLKCGLLMVYALHALPEEEKEFIQHPDNPELDLLENVEKEISVRLRFIKISNVYRCDSMRIIMYSAICNSLTTSGNEMKIFIEYDDMPLLRYLFSHLIDCGRRLTSSSSEIIEVSRMIVILVNYFRKLTVSIFEQLFNESLAFVWSHLEHFIDIVSNNTRLFFNQLVNLAAYHYNKGNKNSINKLIEYMKPMNNYSPTRLISMYALCAGMGANFVLGNFQNVQESLLTCAMKDASIGNEVVKTYTFLMTSHLTQIEENDFLEQWIKPVVAALKQSHNSGAYKFYQKIITAAFQMRPSVFNILCPTQSMGTRAEWETLLKCLQITRITSLNVPSGINENVDNNNSLSCGGGSGGSFWRGLIEKKKLELFMINQDEEVRLLALEVIVQCHKSTELMSDWEIVYLVSYYSYNISTQIPSSRSRMITLYKKLFVRIEAGYKVLVKEIASMQSYIEKNRKLVDDNMMKVLKQFEHKKKFYRAFVLQFIALLINDLTPHANYPRRASALELLLRLESIATANEWRISFSREDVINLKRILFDSYENNKLMACRLLRTLQPQAIGLESEQSTCLFFETSMKLATNVKPSKCLSAAYMFKVCLLSKYSFQPTTNQSKLAITKAEEDATNTDQTFKMLTVLIRTLKSVFHETQDDIFMAAQNNPIHGLILSIRTLIQDRDKTKDNLLFSKLFEDLVNECLLIKQIILPVVCNASPEGYLPDCNDSSASSSPSSVVLCYNNQNSEASSSKSQMILFYAWRTMKEMTLLLAEICKQAITLQHTMALLNEQHLIDIGEFFVELFILSKHRGVFEQAFVGFSIVCERFWNSNIERINTMPKRWLNESLAMCLGQKVDNRLCATRRSAGLPFLILAIVCEELSSSRTCLKSTIEQLLIGSNNVENDESRMHSMNILRAIFRHSKLTNATSIFVGRGMMVALSGFKSNIWGVRNSATLLYSILINKMFGVTRTQDIDNVSFKNKLTLTNFYMRYADLFTFLLNILAEESTRNNSMVLHPVLYILTRLYPSHIDRRNEHLEKYLPYVNICMSHSTFYTRDLAARASIPLISSELINAHLLTIFCRISNQHIKDCECQGLLLQIWHILKTTHFTKELPISEYLRKGMHLFDNVGTHYSHMTVALYMEIIALLLIRFPRYNDLNILKDLALIVSKQRPTGGGGGAGDVAADESKLFLTCRSTFKWSRLKLLLFIIINKFEHVDITYDALANEIIHYLYGNDFEVKRYCLLFLIYLNQIYNDFQYKEQPLFTAGELEMPTTIKELVDSFDVKSQKELLTYSHPYLIYFLSGELKFKRDNCSMSTTTEYFVLIFLLLMYYPCIIVNIFGYQNALDVILSFGDCDNNEELISAILSCINTLLLKLPYEILLTLNYRKLIDVMMASASPAAADYRRLTVCHLLVSVKCLFYGKPILKNLDLYDCLNIVMVLLEDGELEIRNAISTFTADNCKLIINDKSVENFYVVPDKARADLMALSVSLLPNDTAICFLFSWSCRHFPDLTNDVSEIFERGELNLYAENIPITYSACKVLNRLLWTLGENLSYTDKSIYLEEQALLVTTVIIDSLNKNPSPMMTAKTKQAVISSLKSITIYLERCQIGRPEFPKTFTTFFRDTILKFLSLSTGNDYPSIESLLTKLYSCILKQTFLTV